MEYKDKRSGRVVFISQCLLNQNLRFPGIAIERGACHNLINLFINNGIGIEPIPCLERLGWGGVSRTKYFRYQPLILTHSSRPFETLVQLGMRIWILNYARLCKKEANKIVRHIHDYISSGYEIIGIVAVNDSPTDGVTKTIDLISSAKKLKSMGFESDELSNPTYEMMKILIPSLCTDGKGIFINKLKKQLENKRIQIQIIGYDPWVEPIQEVERIAKSLGLEY